MKKLLLLICLFLGYKANGQNTLDILWSLSEGRNAAEDMPNVLQWINLNSAPIFISNIQKSNSYNGDNVFVSFSVYGRPPKFELKNTDGTTILLKQVIDKPRPKSQQIRSNLSIEMKAYDLHTDVGIFKETAEFYFSQACKVSKLSNEMIIANALNYMVEQPDKGGSKLPVMVRQVNLKMKSNMQVPRPEDDTKNFYRDFVAVFPGQRTRDAIFHTYIKGKTDQETKKNLNLFFQVTRFYEDGVEQKLKNMLNPTLQVAMNNAEAVVFPLSILKPGKGANMDSLVRFEFKEMTGKIDYFEKNMKLIFKGKFKQGAVPVNGKLQGYDHKVKKLTLKKVPAFVKEGSQIDRFEILLTEKEITFYVNSIDGYQYELFRKPWPADWLKRSPYRPQ